MSRSSTQTTNVHRDIGHTILAGPLRFVVPLAGYGLLYPLLLARHGQEILGLWSLLYSVVALIGAGDIGFSQILTREAGLGRSREELREARADYRATNRAYLVVTLLLILLFLLLRRWLPLSARGLYPEVGFVTAVVLTIAGSMTQLGGRLDAAILAARQDNLFVQLTWSLAPILLFIPAIGGTLLHLPLEGLGAGICLAGFFVRFRFQKRLKKGHPDWEELAAPLCPRETRHRTIQLCRRGIHFYTLSIGMMLRPPLVRFILASTVGLASVGVFEIGLRVTQTMRDLIASGFNVLYPGFSYFFRNRDREMIIETSRLSIGVLIPVGSLALSIAVCFALPFFSWWLSEVPPQLIPATIILSGWQLITLFNVPFWYMLQAAGLERIGSRSVWLHTLLICALYPAARLFSLDLLDFCLYWTVSSLATQLMIYTTVEKKLSLFFSIVGERSTLIIIGASLVLYGYSLFLALRPSSPLQTASLFLPPALLFVALNLKLSFRRLRRFFKKT